MLTKIKILGGAIISLMLCSGVALADLPTLCPSNPRIDDPNWNKSNFSAYYGFYGAKLDQLGSGHVECFYAPFPTTLPPVLSYLESTFQAKAVNPACLQAAGGINIPGLNPIENFSLCSFTPVPLAK